MARTYTTKPGDMLDLICYRTYDGRQSGAVEQVLAANIHLFEELQMPVLRPGLELTLPDLDMTRMDPETQKLWD